MVGLNNHIKDICDRFAAEGFTALAPDLYKGEIAKAPDDAGKLMMALNIAEAEKILRGAIQALLAHPSCTSKTVGVVVFAWADSSRCTLLQRMPIRYRPA